MSRKKKRSRNGKAGRQDASKKGGGLLRISIIVAAVGVAAGLLLAGGGDKGPKALGGETRETLSPRYFVGKTAKAYEVARRIPEVLDRIYCYCRCQDNFGHKSLLTCYVDRHASQCGVCMDEALMAYDLVRKGYDTDEVVERVDSYFSKRRI